MQLHHDTKLFEEVINNTMEETGIEKEIIRKDYFVSLFLKVYLKYEPELVFKGGTSLSKCYDCIDRFSEDIDITFVGNGTKLTQGQKRRVNHNVLKVCDDLGFKVLNDDSIRTRRMFNQYIIDTGYMSEVTLIREQIIVEIALQTIPFPVEKRPLNSFISTYLEENKLNDLMVAYELTPVALNVQTQARTFIDKVFAICDYYMTARFSETSRHIYDLYKLWPYVKGQVPTTLILDVRSVRQELSVCPSAAEGIDVNDLLRNIIIDGVYKDDYENITQVLLFEKVTYDTTIKVLEEIIDSGLFK